MDAPPPSSPRLRIPRLRGSIAPATYQGPFADAHPRALELEALMQTWNGRLPDEYDSVHCTTGAWCIRAAVGGRAQLWGFDEAAPIDAAIRHAGWGHDFAVVEDRFLVDPWAVHFVANAAASATKYVHDLQDPDDLAEIHRLWGPPAEWVSVNDFCSPHRLAYEHWETEDLLDAAESGGRHALAEAEWRASLAGIEPPTSAAWLEHARAVVGATARPAAPMTSLPPGQPQIP